MDSRLLRDDTREVGVHKAVPVPSTSDAIINLKVVPLTSSERGQESSLLGPKLASKAIMEEP